MSALLLSDYARYCRHRPRATIAHWVRYETRLRAGLSWSALAGCWRMIEEVIR